MATGARRAPAGGPVVRDYDPARPPDPDAWLALDESERVALVERYHRRARVRLPNRRLHAVVHVVVENQLAGRLPAAERALARLTAEGLDRHDAIHALASVVMRCLWSERQQVPRPSDLGEEYVRQLEQLTAQAWLEGED